MLNETYNNTCPLSYELSTNMLYINTMYIYLCVISLSFIFNASFVYLLWHINIVEDVVKITLFNFGFGLQLNAISNVILEIRALQQLKIEDKCALDVGGNTCI
jgi:hypothetical protein